MYLLHAFLMQRVIAHLVKHLTKNLNLYTPSHLLWLGCHPDRIYQPLSCVWSAAISLQAYASCQCPVACYAPASCGCWFSLWLPPYSLLGLYCYPDYPCLGSFVLIFKDSSGDLIQVVINLFFSSGSVFVASNTPQLSTG